MTSPSLNKIFLFALVVTVLDGLLLLLYIIGIISGVSFVFSNSAEIQDFGYQLLTASQSNSFFAILLSFFLFIGFKVCSNLNKIRQK